MCRDHDVRDHSHQTYIVMLSIAATIKVAWTAYKYKMSRNSIFCIPCSKDIKHKSCVALWTGLCVPVRRGGVRRQQHGAARRGRRRRLQVLRRHVQRRHPVPPPSRLVSRLRRMQELDMMLPALSRSYVMPGKVVGRKVELSTLRSRAFLGRGAEGQGGARPVADARGERRS